MGSNNSFKPYSRPDSRNSGAQGGAMATNGAVRPQPLRDPMLIAVVLLGTASIAGCPGEQFVSCQGPTVSHPEGKCSAYYYQADFRTGGATTQALVSCRTSPAQPGGNVVSFHDLSRGIGLRWLDAHTLEVAVPDGARLEDKRAGDTYSGYKLHYVYRTLQSTEPAYEGCGVKSR